MKKTFRRVFSLFLTLGMLLNFGTNVFAEDIEDNSIKIGDYVLMGIYNGEPILWRCVDIDENGPLMFSDKIIDFKCYDAFGDNTSGSHGRGFFDDNPDRKGHRTLLGSNYWEDSNIRDWLNSDADTGEIVWSCGNPPAAECNYNAYEDAAGFLAYFTKDEIASIKTVRHKVLVDTCEYDNQKGDTKKNQSIYKTSYQVKDPSEILQNYENAFSMEVTDTIFLPDEKDIYTLSQNSEILGKDYFRGVPTIGAIRETRMIPVDSIELETRYSEYWLRSPYSDFDNNMVACIASKSEDDIWIKCSAHCDNVGIRPMFYLNECEFKSGTGAFEKPYTIEDEDVFKPYELEDEIIVRDAGVQIIFDQKPIVIDGRTVVPMRAVFESLYAKVDWDESTKTVTAVNNRGDITIKLTIGENVLYKNDEPIELDVPAQIIGDRTMIPLRAVSEAMDCSVFWDEETKTISISTNPYMYI